MKASNIGKAKLERVNNLDVNKTHSHSDISIRMLKICDSVVTEPLLFSKTLLNVEYFQILGKSHIS